jgi:hypothetical protein
MIAAYRIPPHEIPYPPPPRNWRPSTEPPSPPPQGVGLMVVVIAAVYFAVFTVKIIELFIH